MKKQSIKTTNHRSISLFFFLGGLMAYLNLNTNTGLILKYITVGAMGLIGLWFLFKPSKDKIWIEGKLLYFIKEGEKCEVNIKDIHAIKLFFSGSQSSSILHKCFIVMVNKETLELPGNIIYSSYNPIHASMKFLMKPLRSINKGIQLIIDDSEVVGKNKPDFSKIV
jgi:hypothetical protein